MSRTIVISLCLMMLGHAISAEAGAPSPFEIGSGIKQISLGGAFVSMADDPTAVFWNPAGMGAMKNPEVKLEGRLKTLGTNLITLSGAYPVEGQGTIGLSGLYYDSGPADSYSESGVRLGTFSDKRMALTIGMGYKSGLLYIGGNGFYLWQGMRGEGINESGNGYGITLGAIYQPDESLRLGIAFRSKAKLKWSDEVEEEISPSARIGLLYSFKSYNSTFKVEADLIQVKGEPLKLSIGAEMAGEEEGNAFFIRGGMADVYIEGGKTGLSPGELTKLNIKPAMGFGFRWKLSGGGALLFDYALRFEPTGMRHFVSVGYGVE
ncbi:hypothetical protein J7M22_04935 [Candidatus Poribacteria bacterium]|nr:hypothetical protein [Candidatus Poribacteria bacterium]